MGGVEPPEDTSEELLVDRLQALNKLIINESPAVKESEYHHLGSGNCAARHLGARLTMPQPFHALDPLVWIPHIDPGFVHGYCIGEHSWVLMFEPGEKVTDISVPLLVSIC